MVPFSYPSPFLIDFGPILIVLGMIFDRFGNDLGSFIDYFFIALENYFCLLGDRFGIHV